LFHHSNWGEAPKFCPLIKKPENFLTSITTSLEKNQFISFPVFCEQINLAKPEQMFDQRWITLISN